MSFRSGFVTDYLNPLQVQAEVDSIVSAFPSLCRLETLPHQTHGYQGDRVEARGPQPMHVLRITAPGATSPRPAVLLMRSQHAREWSNALAVVETARQLVENYRPSDSDPLVQDVVTILQRVEMLIIPEGNPDGARLSFFDAGQRMWRKNLRPPSTAGGCPGVDCNRNFPRYFGEAGSSNDPCTEIYHGPAALSEPESANIATLVARERQLIFAIDSHSYGQNIFRPSPNGGTFISSEPVSPADDAVYRHLEGAMNRGIKQIQGITYATGSTSNHAGTTDEFVFFDHHVFGFDLESGTDFQPPKQEAVLAAREVAEAVRALGRCAAGLTGLDIPALLAQRTPVTDANAPPEAVSVASTPWQVLPLPPERWRRFLVHCPVKNLQRRTAELRALLEAGLDVECDHAGPGPLEVVASAADLVQLLRRGYQPAILADLHAESSHGTQNRQQAAGVDRHRSSRAPRSR
jgi:hypothetical protein